MNIQRVVPNLKTNSMEASREFYASFLGLHIEMDMDWIVTFISQTNPMAQLSVITSDLTAPIHPDVTIEIDNVDELHAEAVRRGFTIAYPLTDEPWGVRRFFVVDPNGRVINLMTHPRG